MDGNVPKRLNMNFEQLYAEMEPLTSDEKEALFPGLIHEPLINRGVKSLYAVAPSGDLYLFYQCYPDVWTSSCIICAYRYDDRDGYGPWTRETENAISTRLGRLTS
jgi:hypothetical protein